MKDNKKITIPKKYIDIGIMAILLLELMSLIYQIILQCTGKGTEDTILMIIADASIISSLTIYKIVRICTKAKKNKKNKNEYKELGK